MKDDLITESGSGWGYCESSLSLGKIDIDALPDEVIEELRQLRKMVEELYYPMKNN